VKEKFIVENKQKRKKSAGIFAESLFLPDRRQGREGK
jgi:hypothetical protein